MIADMRAGAACADALRRQRLTLRAVDVQVDAHSFRARQGGLRNTVEVRRVLDGKNPAHMEGPG